MKKGYRLKKSHLDHARRVCIDTTNAVIKKYKIGQKEHGGNLWRKPVINFMGDELTDHIVYFHVLKEQWNEMEKIATAALDGKSPDMIAAVFDYSRALVKIRNILTIGNPEGVKEQGD